MESENQALKKTTQQDRYKSENRELEQKNPEGKCGSRKQKYTWNNPKKDCIAFHISWTKYTVSQQYKNLQGRTMTNNQGKIAHDMAVT